MIDSCLDMLGFLLQHRKDRAYVEWHRKYAKGLLKFNNLHEGEDCFIIGNGPSLNKMDLDRLGDYYTFGLNKIHLLFDRGTFRPSYHVAVNPLVIEQSVKTFEDLPCPSFLSFRPSQGKVMPLEHINFIMTGEPLTFCENLIEKVYEGWTVTYVAMQIAYYMGFKNVYLIGVDHNFKTTGAPNEKQFLKGNDVNHFDPNYFGNKEWHLPDLQGSEISYNIAKFFYERNGRRIYDATIDGKLQIFQKISFNNALEACNKRDGK